jgi:hypothetical protein
VENEKETKSSKLNRLEELQLKKAELEVLDLEETIAEREMKRSAKRDRSTGYGAVLKQNARQENAVQDRCNHRKGGNGADGIIGGQGDDPQYAVLKHRMPNGDVWIRCLRCAKSWKPPVKSQFTFDGKFNEEGYNAAFKVYQDALAYPSRNQMSGSIVFGFSDGEYYREVTKSTNLR